MEAVTGLHALDLVRAQTTTLSAVAKSLKVRPDEAEAKVLELTERLKEYDKELRALKQEQLNLRIDAMLEHAQPTPSGLRQIVRKLDAASFPRSAHQQLLDSVASKLGNGVAFFTQVEEGTLSLLAAVGSEARSRIKAGDLIKELSVIADGRGGGRPDKAQAGSKFPEKEALVLAEAQKLITRVLG